jgi:hypothetical protein
MYSCTETFYLISGTFVLRFFIRVPEYFIVFPGHFSFVSLFVYRNISLYFRNTSLSFLYSCTGIFRCISGTLHFLFFYSCTRIFRCISGTLRFLFFYSCTGIVPCISGTLIFILFYSCTGILFVFPGHIFILFYSCTGIFPCISGTPRFLLFYSCTGIFICISSTPGFLFFYSCTGIFFIPLFLYRNMSLSFLFPLYLARFVACVFWDGESALFKPSSDLFK